MAKRVRKSKTPESAVEPTPAPALRRRSALVDMCIIYRGDCLEQFHKLSDACIAPVYIDLSINSNRNYEVFWGETKEKRAFEDRRASTQACIDTMRPRRVKLAPVLKKTGCFYYHCDWRRPNGNGRRSLGTD